MSETPEKSFDPQLLELHLGRLSAEEQAKLRERIGTDEALAAENDALGQVFEALAMNRVQNAPNDLVGRTLTRVQLAGPSPRVVRASDESPAAAARETNTVIRLGSNLRDIIAVAAVIVLAIGIGVPGMLHMRDRSHRIGCSRNLTALGIGVQQYANAFNTSLPFAGWSQASSWQPSGDPGVNTVLNRRHVYPLLRMAYVADPRVFVCPAQDHIPMPADEVQRHHDFLEARNVSYAYQNMAGVRPSVNDDPRLPIMSDENPLFADGQPLFDARRLTRRDPAAANSHAHRGAGQNILTLGGNVIWADSPFSGIKDDNIWILHDITEYTGREGPISATDSHLLK